MSTPLTSGVISSPFIGAQSSVARVMLKVLLALVPGTLAYAYVYGWGVVVNIGLACVSAWGFEVLMLLLLNRALKPFVFDGSALVTAVLLALALPPLTVWWLPVVGTFFAIVVAKHLYGGLGYNPFNPAMAAYAVLLVSFPKQMSLWLTPLLGDPHQLDFVSAVSYAFTQTLPGDLQIDAMSSATVLDYLRTQLTLNADLTRLQPARVFGVLAGSGMEWVALLYLAGGLWLLYQRIISWHIPVALLATLAAVAALAHFIEPQRYYGVLVHLLGGASILGAFFIATDPVTAATTPRGKLIYGAGIGFLTFAIRTWGGYPDGVAFAVLLMGLTVPLLDQYTVPKVFGQKGRRRV